MKKYIHNSGEKEQEERSKIEAERNKSQEREVARSKRDLERKKNVNFDQYNQMAVDIKPAPGKRLPHFVESYKELNLHADLQANLDKLGFVQPTPIQKYAIPVILDGQDVMATAQTGNEISISSPKSWTNVEAVGKHWHFYVQ